MLSISRNDSVTKIIWSELYFLWYPFNFVCWHYAGQNCQHKIYYYSLATVLFTYRQGSNWGGMRGDGIPLVEKNDKKTPSSLTIPFGLSILC